MRQFDQDNEVGKFSNSSSVDGLLVSDINSPDQDYAGEDVQNQQTSTCSVS